MSKTPVDGGASAAVRMRRPPARPAGGRHGSGGLGMLPQHHWFWALILLATAMAGLIYNIVFAAGVSPLAGLAYGVCMGSAALAFDRGLILAGLQARIRQLPALLFVPAAELAYVAMIVAGNALGGVVVWTFGLTADPLSEAVRITPRVLTYALAVSALLVFVIRMRDLIGGEVFINLMAGRYHRPVEEERIFLFLDVVGSTAFAETHGDLRAQEYLAAVFATLAEPVRRNLGSTDDYVGDLAMITWPMPRGLKDARCVSCVFDVLARIEADREGWIARFGTVPRLRAALHGGSVVTAEVGVDRHKIAYFGDAVNVTSRIESLCRPLGTDILISQDLLDRIPRLPPGVHARPLGVHALRGRGRPVAVATLERGAPAARPAAEAPAATLRPARRMETLLPRSAG